MRRSKKIEVRAEVAAVVKISQNFSEHRNFYRRPCELLMNERTKGVPGSGDPIARIRARR